VNDSVFRNVTRPISNNDRWDRNVDILEVVGSKLKMEVELITRRRGQGVPPMFRMQE